MTTRITGGSHRGRTLRVPKGAGLRPTTERVRGAIFSVLGAGAVKSERVLDLFAGTGALGIEALSRGASGGGLRRGEWEARSTTSRKPCQAGPSGPMQSSPEGCRAGGRDPRRALRTHLCRSSVRLGGFGSVDGVLEQGEPSEARWSGCRGASLNRVDGRRLRQACPDPRPPLRRYVGLHLFERRSS